MNRRTWPGRVLALTAAFALAGACAPPPPPPPPAPQPLPPLLIEEVTAEPPTPQEVWRIPPPLITLTAVDAPVREMLLLIAEEGGISMVLDPEVGGTASFHLDRVPAPEALELIARAGGFSLATARRGMILPFEPRNAYFLPRTNIEGMTASELQARYGVTRVTAEWIVEERRRRDEGWWRW